MLTQAKTHREAGLLILHHVKYPFGQEDSVSAARARFVISDVESCASLTGRYSRIIVLLLTIASIEFTAGNRRQTS